MDREYTFYEATTSICHICEERVQGKIVFKNNSAYIIKYCPEHGEVWSLLEESAAYHKKKKNFDKPGTKMVIHTQVNKGCPYDCGICPQHDQHGCIGLIEVTDKCNLSCPICYSNSGFGENISLDNIEKMLDFFIESEGGEAEILQISGGEPTIHDDIIEIIRMAKSKAIKYVMLNTNGIRIAEDIEFAEKLSEFNSGGFEIYLQFDGLKDSYYKNLRGKSLFEIKKKAIKNLSKFQIPVTLVCTVEKGINDEGIGELFFYALKEPFVRGINFQPVAYFGRKEIKVEDERMTLSGVLSCLEKTTMGMLKTSDFVPLPCNSERVAITYLYRDKLGSYIPITRDKKIEKYLSLINNTFVFTIEDLLKNAGMSINSLKNGCNCFDFIKDFRKILPINFFMKSADKKKEYINLNTFRISVSSFIDTSNFDIRAMQKECVHVITKDLKKIPFSAYNMFYRKEKS